MATTPSVRQPGALHRRRIIERPRLLALLDESKARVRTLVAPAGYGKTTLAEQWVGKGGRRGAWFTARRSSTDVAALALGIARASLEVVPDSDARLREHLRALPAPAENVEVLAELLGEDLGSWPDDAWLVLDEYQEIAGSDNSELFVDALVAASRIQLLLASRQRPSWVSARRILYGEVLELNQTELSMDSHEAAEVLAGRSAPSATGLVALANGWPAVIGLAGVSTAEIDDEESVPGSLYAFFADEVFSSLEEDVQLGVATLAVAPVISRGIATELLGSERAEKVCAAALDIGILVERGSQLDIHPLARSFLNERGMKLKLSPAADSVERCLNHYRRERDWDAAFDVVVRHAREDQLADLLLEALDELLETARISTIDTWCGAARDAGLTGPVFSLARAEALLRRGRLAEARSHAEDAASDRSLEYRALSIAGRAAHLASREEDALDLYRRAEAVAVDEAARREALSGQLVCMTDLEIPQALITLEELTGGVGLADARDAIRAAGHRLHCQTRFGALDLAEADLAYRLLPAVDDPQIAASFQSMYSGALALSARYPEAEEVALAFLGTVRRYRLDFALPYALCAVAIAEIGLRKWRQAEHHLSQGMAAARADANVHAQQHCLAAQLRAYAQEGRLASALGLSVSSLPAPTRSMHAELLASRALVLVAAERVDEALGVVGEIRGTTLAIEPTVLIAAVDAIASLKRREAHAIDLVAGLSETAFSRGGVDLLVTAYRSTPELLAVLFRFGAPELVTELVSRAGDQDLARVVGLPIAEDDPRQRLSTREREVYELLRQGLTNRQIAQILFISEGTVKAHVHHIFDKLGIRSRTAIAVQAVLERSGQATSAIDVTGAGSGAS